WLAAPPRFPEIRLWFFDHVQFLSDTIQLLLTHLVALRPAGLLIFGYLRNRDRWFEVCFLWYTCGSPCDGASRPRRPDRGGSAGTSWGSPQRPCTSTFGRGSRRWWHCPSCS